MVEPEDQDITNMEINDQIQVFEAIEVEGEPEQLTADEVKDAIDNTTDFSTSLMKKGTAVGVDAADPNTARKEIVGQPNELDTRTEKQLDQKITPIRKTKQTGISAEVGGVMVYFKKGGKFRRGTSNEENLINLVNEVCGSDGLMNITFVDGEGHDYQIKYIKGAVDLSREHGNVVGNRGDVGLSTVDGLYRISIKKVNAEIVGGVRKILAPILFKTGQLVRNYAKEKGIRPGSYISVRITNEDLIRKLWYGEDLLPGHGCVIVADFSSDTNEFISNNCTLKVKHVFDPSDPISEMPDNYKPYILFHIENSTYKILARGAGTASQCARYEVNDLILPSINTGDAMPALKNGQKLIHRRKKRRATPTRL